MSGTRGRPRVSSQQAIEDAAMRLFGENGYDGTTIAAIAAAAGVGRTSVFRYWGSKSDIIWAEFERHIDRLEELLTAVPDQVPTMSAVRESIVEDFRLSSADSAAWLNRFVVIDATATLRIEYAFRCERWASTVAAFVARRTEARSDGVQAQSVAGALLATYVATVRRWVRSPIAVADAPSDLDAALAPLCELFESWLPVRQG